jgi:hypothetical protein
MDRTTQIIVKLWMWIVSIFGYNVNKSTEPDAVGFYRAIIVGFKVAGRLIRCDIVPHRDESGGFHCAILQRVGNPALTPRMLQDLAEYIARDYFHRVPDSLSWIYIPIRSESVIPEDVLEFQFVRRGAKEDMRIAWSVAVPEVADAWIGRSALAMEFGVHISVR